jgi:hypothetical protein
MRVSTEELADPVEVRWNGMDVDLTFGVIEDP